MPDLEIVDPHIHLFDVHNTPRPTTPLVKLFGWNDRVLRAAAKRLFPSATIGFFSEHNYLISDYLPPEFRADSAPAKVDQYVHIQAGWKDKQPVDAVGETRWLASLPDPPAAIVGYADLSLGDDVLPVLLAHRAAAPTFRGVRHMLAHHPASSVMNFCEDPSMAGRASFGRGMKQLAAQELCFDAWAYSHQLKSVADLAVRSSDVSIVLCHGGTPVGYGGDFGGVGATRGERDRIAAEWRDGVSAVAAAGNTLVKLSGFLMPVLGFGFEHRSTKPGVAELVDVLGPLVRHCIEAFGTDRCMFASNFPVDKVSADYGTIVEAMLELTAGEGHADRQAVFAGTAKRFYRL